MLNHFGWWLCGTSLGTQNWDQKDVEDKGGEQRTVVSAWAHYVIVIAIIFLTNLKSILKCPKQNHDLLYTNNHSQLNHRFFSIWNSERCKSVFMWNTLNTFHGDKNREKLEAARRNNLYYCPIMLLFNCTFRISFRWILTLLADGSEYNAALFSRRRLLSPLQLFYSATAHI